MGPNNGKKSLIYPTVTFSALTTRLYYSCIGSTCHDHKHTNIVVYNYTIQKWSSLTEWTIMAIVWCRERM